MSNAPIVLAIMGCEQAIMDTISDICQATLNSFGEASFITHLVEQFMATYEDLPRTTESQSVYRSLGRQLTAVVSLGAGRCSPYTEARCMRLCMLFSGSISPLLPSSGKPGGEGMGVVMINCS